MSRDKLKEHEDWENAVIDALTLLPVAATVAAKLSIMRMVDEELFQLLIKDTYTLGANSVAGEEYAYYETQSETYCENTGEYLATDIIFEIHKTS